MYKITHLRFDSRTNCYWMEPTDYDLMTKGEAESLVTELNSDAIESNSEDRWIVERDL
jgi:hypothetical protein